MNEVFEALAHPVRRDILKLLRKKAMSAGEIAEHFPIAKATLSGHFNVLKNADLVSTERQGTTIIYRLNMSVMEEALGAFMSLAGLKGEGKFMTMAGTHDTNGSQGGSPLSLNLWPIIIVNTITIAGMSALSAWANNQIPAGAKIPVHWNFEGVADRFAEAREVLYIMPALALAMTALFLILPWLDPRRANIAASGKFWNAGGILSVLLIAYVHAIMVKNATGSKIDMVSALVPALCVMFAIIGNYLGKTRPNWFGGVRTPWTLSSDYAWEKTHRLAGRLFVLSAVAGLGAWAVLGAIPGMVALVAGVTGGAIISVVASWFYWRNDPERTEGKA